jgi:hypothetical protein
MVFWLVVINAFFAGVKDKFYKKPLSKQIRALLLILPLGFLTMTWLLVAGQAKKVHQEYFSD